MLDDKYGIPWSLSRLDLQILPQEQVSVEPTVTDPTQIFSLTLPDNVHLLRQVVKTRLYRVDLVFVGDERVEGILDTGTQSSLLNAPSWRCICTKMPSLFQPSDQAKWMIEASGAPLTVYGEVSRCPDRLPVLCQFGSSRTQAYNECDSWYGLFDGVWSKD